MYIGYSNANSGHTKYTRRSNEWNICMEGSGDCYVMEMLSGTQVMMDLEQD